MEYLVEELNAESLILMYSEHGLRPKEIGGLVGLTEDAIRLRIKKYNIPKIPLSKKRSDSKFIYTGVRKDKKNQLSEDILRNLCLSGKTDKEIGDMFGLTGEGVAYKRSKFGILPAREVINNLEYLGEASKEELESDYLSLNQEEFSKKYKVSKTVWLPYLRSLGISSKKVLRDESFPPFTPDQVTLIIGGLLGDGSVPEGNFYCESHSKKQKGYLEYKYKKLLPYSSSMYSYFKGKHEQFRMSTVSHPNFKPFREAFYTHPKGKGIPLDFMEKHWEDGILAYWFLDDGTYDDGSNSVSFFNFCPEESQLSLFIEYLNDIYGWGFRYSDRGDIYSITFSSDFHKAFFDIVKKIAPPCMLYKIPERYLDSSDLEGLKIHELGHIKGKHYRVGSTDQKEEILKTYKELYKDKSFPYLTLSEDKREYLLRSFCGMSIECTDGVVLPKNGGYSLCESFFPNMYASHRKGFKSPVEYWSIPEYRDEIIEEVLSTQDNLLDRSIRKVIKRSPSSVSNFNPTVAKYIYSLFGGGKVLDYSAGFGSRLLACMSLGMDYTGYDVSKETVNNLNKLGNFLKDNTTGSFNIKHEPFQEAELLGGYYDLAFSSPPYYDYESYGDDEGQSILTYNTYDEWVERYWEASIKKSFKALKQDGIFGVCLHPTLCSDMIHRLFRICIRYGYYLITDLKVPYKSIYGKGDKYEVCFFFSKHNNNYKAKFFNVGSPIARNDISNHTDFKKDSNPIFKTGIQKKVPTKRVDVDFEALKQRFLSVHKELGTSRGAYKDPTILGLASHSIEHYFKGWVKFIEYCGVTPHYKKNTPKDIVDEYLKACYNEGRLLSFVEYGRLKGGSSGALVNRLKRLFNKGGKFEDYKGELFSVAEDPNLYLEFLENFE